VDASVHADVEERATQQSQPPRQPDKRLTGYSLWGSHAADTPPSVRFRGAPATTSAFAAPANIKNRSIFNSPFFQPETKTQASTARTTGGRDSATTPTIDGHSGRTDQQPGLFGGLSANRPHDRLTGPQLFDTVASPPARPQTSRVSASFREKELGVISTSSFPNPFPKATSTSQHRAKSKQHKPLPLNSAHNPPAGLRRPGMAAPR
jgi:hypothetical protein